MRIVIALGGNALQKRGEPLTADVMRANAHVACQQIAQIAPGNEVVVVHGNGPQVGLLALQNAAYTAVPAYPLDVLVAQSVGMIGYILEQELANMLPVTTALGTLVTQTEVDSKDPAFSHPTKPIGPVYSKAEAESLAAEKGWSIAPDGEYYRRVVPSPKPKKIVNIKPITWLLEKGAVTLCAGGGGVAVVRDDAGHCHGVEAVIDKDLVSALLSRDISADLFVIGTDVNGVYDGWGTPQQRVIRSAHPDALEQMGFASGSMGPKVEACIDFVRSSGKKAVIGTLSDLPDILRGTAGTTVTMAHEGINWA